MALWVENLTKMALKESNNFNHKINIVKLWTENVHVTFMEVVCL